MPQLSTLNETEHADEVMGELIGSMKKMKTKPKHKILQKLRQAIRILESMETEAPIERVNKGGEREQTSEGEDEVERLEATPAVTTSTNPTDARVLQNAPHQTHLCMKVGYWDYCLCQKLA